LKSSHYRVGNLKGNEMLYVNETLISSEDQLAAADLKAVQTFLGKNGTALANAAYHLAGGAASGAVFRLIDDVRKARKLTSSHINCLCKLHALLFLEKVGDPERTETALFAKIVPGSRLVDEFCMLADRVDDLLVSIGQSDGQGAELFVSAA
jgi:hypothetical protein